MQIAQIAPLMEAVPPKLYGGTERIVAYLTDELVAMGHEVTLFASGDSVDDGDPRSRAARRALRLDPTVRDQRRASARHARERRAARARLRCRPPPLRLPRLSGVAASGSAIPRHSARPPRSARTEVALSRVFRRAGGLDFQFPARAVARGGLRRHGVSWPARTAAAPRQREWRISGFSRPHFTGEGAGPGDPHSGAGRHAAEDRRQDRPRSTENTSRRKSSLFSLNRMSSSSARSASTRRPSSWAMPPVCYSRSRGRSRSAL